MSSYHAERVLSQWNWLRAVLDQKLRVPLQGDSLDLASLVAVARYDALCAFWKQELCLLTSIPDMAPRPPLTIYPKM
jgi:hypothetical protein